MRRLVGPTPQNSWQVGSDEVDVCRIKAAANPLSIPARPKRLTLDLAHTALVVIDLQNDFCHEKGWLASTGRDVSAATSAIDTVAELLPVLRSTKVPIVWVTWAARADRANIPPSVLHTYDFAGGGRGIGSPLPGSGEHAMQTGSWSAEVVSRLIIADSDLHVAKHRLSGFFDTPLDSILRNLRADTLMFAGVNADQCVLATLTDAACLGYDPILLLDAVSTTSPDFCMRATVYNVEHGLGFTANAADIIASLGTAQG
ncbi:cysteine hydrolase family protein [Nocardia sp. NPDC058058]|uniref:cysteine hydrolase family protein n=1 Tax=Nocardia sp. NPDC058058 TaxID=3346317 RepID=UPI0036DD9690